MNKKRLFNIKSLKIIIVFITIPLSTYAQNEIYYPFNSKKINQSLISHSQSISYFTDNLYKEFQYTPSLKRLPISYTKMIIPKANYYNSDFYTSSPFFSAGEYHLVGALKQTNKGAITGSGSQTNLIGLGTINQVSFGYSHNFNNKLSTYIGVNTIKFSMPFAINQAIGVSGLFLYTPQENIRFKIFGNYSISSYPGMQTFQYGGSMAIDISERFGTEIGVQRYFNPVQKRWETIPIVVPYYKFDNFTLGIDVGGILYEILYHLIK